MAELEEAILAMDALSAQRKRYSTIASSSTCGLTFALQALLSRHESYVAETQLENETLNAKIAALEAERTTLQDANEKIVAENRSLLTKLDTINKTYTESDSTVKSLEALLKDTELEVRRLNALARRAEELEAQVHDMERERTQMSQKLTESESESKSALTRWRESEKRLRILEMELEKIEWEAKRETEKHEEIVARLERERILDRELGGAEGRLKGAAAVQSIQAGQNDNVVSHFVRDILQDNATLQAGIVELRELLQSSNEEVHNLRQQIMQHQPMSEGNDQQPPSSLPLDQQIGWEPPAPSDVQREVHVHHHYHAKLAAKGNRTPTVRKRAVRRTMMPGMISSPESSIPSTPTTGPKRYASSPIMPLALHQPVPRKNNRWSVQSAASRSSNFSSLPSSPRSYFDRYSSIFDRIEPGDDSSRPTSPESVSVMSSPKTTHNAKEGSNTWPAAIPEHSLSEASISPLTPPTVSPQEDSTPATVVRRGPSPDLTPKPSQILAPAPSDPIDIRPSAGHSRNASALSVEPLAPETFSIPEYQIPDHETPSSEDNNPLDDTQVAAEEDTDPFSSNVTIRPTLQRSSSHDSLVSISGMDIHIAKRPSPPSFSRSYFTPAHLPLSTINGLKTSSKQPLTAVASVAASASQFQTLTSTRGHGEGRRGLEIIASSPAAKTYRSSSQQSSPAQLNSSPGVAGRVGGWVRSRWGVAPTKSVGDLRSVSAEAPPPPTEAHATQVANDRAVPSAESVSGDAQPADQQQQTSPPRNMPSSVTSTNSRAFSANAAISIGGSSSLKSPSIGTGSTPFGSMQRMPGINQKGPIPGFWLQQRAPSQVEVDRSKVNFEGLRDALGGGGG
ncbi:uncharacterized protein AB675_7989 [Cyphellophora attinorum]|uniref:Uncharacterized protein n=1 Tax=Cyphellophora attinorum TaxID=1664694 RepID=A0A0N0NN84_9EURO|nr:uncharacterized protein AB675_7989 [Phialophora attinorum]KPI41228.1 hypothetical protein AB675_7989 [Phialophora attinorum]